MTQILQLPRPIPLGWLDLAHVLAAAPARRRREFALTEPSIFRSECFAEDLPEPALAPAPARLQARPRFAAARAAALLCAVPASAALLGAAVTVLERFA